MSKTPDLVRARLIIERWGTALGSKSKTMNSVSDNFDEVIYGLHTAKISFDVVYDLLDRIVKIHQPNNSTIKYTYKRMKDINIGVDEFGEDWIKRIRDKCFESFYSFYELEEPVEEKKFGSMSAREYSKQRKHAESFPLLKRSTAKDNIANTLQSVEEILKETGFSEEPDDNIKR